MGPPVALVGDDPRLVEDVRRLCAVTGLALTICSGRAEAAARWRTAPAVLVALERWEDVAGLPRRPGVLLLADPADDLAAWRVAVRIGAEEVLRPGADDRAVLDRLTRATDGDGPAGRLVAVLPGSPGAGASTVAVALGVAAAAGGPATLVDLDPLGGGIDLLLGLEHADGARWPQLATTRGVVRPSALDAALPRAGALRVVSAARDAVAPVPPEATGSVLEAARRLGAVVADIGGVPADAGDVALRTADAVVLVVRAEVRAVAAAAAVARRVGDLGPEPVVAVRAARRDRLTPADVARALGLGDPVTVPTDPDLPAAADRGDLGRRAARGRIAAAAAELARRVAEPRA